MSPFSTVFELASLAKVLFLKHVTPFATNSGRNGGKGSGKQYEESMDVSEEDEAATGESMSIDTNESSPKEDMSIEEINQEIPGSGEVTHEIDSMDLMARMLNISKAELAGV